MTFDLEDISIAEEISFPTTYNEKAYAYFYKPQNKNYEGLAEEKPPLLFFVQEGPPVLPTTP